MANARPVHQKPASKPASKPTKKPVSNVDTKPEEIQGPPAPAADTKPVTAPERGETEKMPSGAIRRNF